MQNDVSIGRTGDVEGRRFLVHRVQVLPQIVELDRNLEISICLQEKESICISFYKILHVHVLGKLIF